MALRGPGPHGPERAADAAVAESRRAQEQAVRPQCLAFYGIFESFDYFQHLFLDVFLFQGVRESVAGLGKKR